MSEHLTALCVFGSVAAYLLVIYLGGRLIHWLEERAARRRAQKPSDYLVWRAKPWPQLSPLYFQASVLRPTKIQVIASVFLMGDAVGPVTTFSLKAMGLTIDYRPQEETATTRRWFGFRRTVTRITRQPWVSERKSGAEAPLELVA